MDGSEGRDEELELYEIEALVKAKYLPFPTQWYTAAYVNVSVPRYFFFSTQCYPLYTTESARADHDLHPS